MKSLKRGVLFLLVVGLLLAGNTAVLAQTATATLYGEVTDPQGAAVVGAKISATLVGTNTVRTTESDENGRYQLRGLPPGKYDVRVEKEGFKATWN